MSQDAQLPTSMAFEVEQKFPVADLTAVEVKLRELGAKIAEPLVEADLYFAHPARNFAKTDEAVRVRRKGEANFVTYKGPKIDATTKTRREIELPIAPGAESAAAWAVLLEALGFARVREVRKSRRKAAIAWQGRQIEASLDEVAGLGTFVELELVVLSEEVEAAKQCIASLAKELALEGSERQSYLELLLQRV